MGRRKGELSASAIDRGWPFQVALPASQQSGGNYSLVRYFCEGMSLCPRAHSVVKDDVWHIVFCFAEKEDAEKFKARFGGVDFSPANRGRGRRWMRWRAPKPKGYGRK